MKRKQIEEIRGLTADEITRRLEDSREAYFKLRMQFSTGQLKDTAQLRESRRDIARLETLLREQQRAETAAGSTP
ncbi:MAG: 50S ribosomal protein L29 [Anaerolineales bacterium]